MGSEMCIRDRLSYDLTFLIVLLTGLYELENTETEFTCPLHPTKKRTA